MADFLKGIFNIAILIFVIWAIANGGEALLILFGLFIGVMLLKCMR